MGQCLNLLNAQSVANEQMSVLKTLLTDRMYYVNSWNNAIFGITIYSDADARRAAVLKLSAKTPSNNGDIQQPALVAAYNIFAQLVSNFNSLQNRVVMCLTLKSVEYSTQVISASNSYFSCIKSA
ncbi:uncharacterized protein LOC129779707 [Toxorhynchites rutilus septentrionalis]|uniref:uncharacterized protein LOC129779707 n=1 Tax=Toxorhynchites rutilus septentrionalis TaxID=329112 RepID=UPI00247A4AFB|nr:uncharacterized protein LOC129779707 [Toxorhynchites rutilus septentrionalis]